MCACASNHLEAPSEKVISLSAYAVENTVGCYQFFNVPSTFVNLFNERETGLDPEP